MDRAGADRQSRHRRALGHAGLHEQARGGQGRPGLIGQFGVGFYSAFMVADRIEVVSRRAGAHEAWVWARPAAAGFTSPGQRRSRPRACRAAPRSSLHLKEDAKKYLETYELERIVRTYSDHILFPIELADDEGEAAPDQRGERPLAAAQIRGQARGLPAGLSRHRAGHIDEPALTLHYRAEGRQNLRRAAVRPVERPFDLFDPGRRGPVKLYVRRVYITDEAELLPPICASCAASSTARTCRSICRREMLQNNPQVAQIRKALTGRVLTELENLAANEPEILRQSLGRIRRGAEGRHLRGLRAAQPAVGACAVYHDDERNTALTEAICGRSEAQPTEIYYLVGESAERLKANPKLEAARARGIEVLLLTDPVDALWTSMPTDFDGKPLKSLSQGEVDFSQVLVEEKATKQEEPAAGTPTVDEASVLAAVKGALGDRVSDVRASQRLTDSPACLVAGGGGFDRELTRLLARQNRSALAKPILELNMRHAIVKAIAGAKESGRDEDLADLAQLLFDQARILDGEVPDDPAAFAGRVNRLVVRGLSTAQG